MGPTVQPRLNAPPRHYNRPADRPIRRSVGYGHSLDQLRCSRQGFDSEDGAVALANGVRYGLAASRWTHDHRTVERLTWALDFGEVWVNCHIPLSTGVPHGGFNDSVYDKDLYIQSGGIHSK